MNWTGGRLQRSRHAGTPLSALQKNHFAKARTRLQNGPPTTSPLKFPVFEIVKDERRALPEYESLLASKVRKNRTQSTLEDYHNTAPLVKRLNSIKRRRSHDNARLLQPHGHRHRSRISNNDDNLTRHPPAVTTKIESNPNRMYGMTQGHGPEQSLEAKRRQLLQRQDWVGTATSKPLKMEFVEDKNWERIGKRRRLRDNEHECRRDVIYRTPVSAINERASIDSRYLPPYDIHDDAISVQIGTSIHGSQGTREEKDLTSQQSRQSDLSDPMLLDAKEVTQRQYHSSWVLTPLGLETEFSADAPSSLATDARMPNRQRTVPLLSSHGSERDDPKTRLPFLLLTCSGPGNATATSEDINGSNSVAAVNAEVAPQANSKLYSGRKGKSGEAFGHLIFTSSPRPKCSSTPSTTVEVAFRINTGTHRSRTVPQADSEPEKGSNDACWKKFLDISGSSVINHNVDTSPLSEATSQDLVALRNDTKAKNVQALAATEDKENNFLPRPTTPDPEPDCAHDPELIKNQNMFASKSEYGGSNDTSLFRDEDSVWREFVFGDKMDADNSSTYEHGGHLNNLSRSRTQPNASSIVVQASSDDAEAPISTTLSSEDSPSSNSYLVPALPPIVETSSPDPLNHLENSSRFIHPKHLRRLSGPKLLFTKPAPSAHPVSAIGFEATKG